MDEKIQHHLIVFRISDHIWNYCWQIICWNRNTVFSVPDFFLPCSLFFYFKHEIVKLFHLFLFHLNWIAVWELWKLNSCCSQMLSDLAVSLSDCLHEQNIHAVVVVVFVVAVVVWMWGEGSLFFVVVLVLLLLLFLPGFKGIQFCILRCNHCDSLQIWGLCFLFHIRCIFN